MYCGNISNANWRDTEAVITERSWKPSYLYGYRGFESHSLRHFFYPKIEKDVTKEQYSSWCRGAPAKGVGRLNPGARVRVSPAPPWKKSLLSTDKGDFFQWYPFLSERVIYLRYDIALRAIIYAFGIWGNGYYIMLAKQVYHAATAVYYIASAIYHWKVERFMLQ